MYKKIIISFFAIFLISLNASAIFYPNEIIVNDKVYTFKNGFTEIGKNKTELTLKNKYQDGRFYSLLFISRDNSRLNQPTLIYSPNEKKIYDSVKFSNSESYSHIYIKPNASLNLNINNLDIKKNHIFIGTIDALNRHFFEESFFSGASFGLNLIIFIFLIVLYFFNKKNIIIKIIIAHIFHFMAIIFSKTGFLYIDLNLISGIELCGLASWVFAFTSIIKNINLKRFCNIIVFSMVLFSILVILDYNYYNLLLQFFKISQRDFLITYNIVFCLPMLIFSLYFTFKKNRLSIYFALISLAPFFQIPIKIWGLLPTHTGFIGIISSSYLYQILISLFILIGVIDYTSKIYREKNKAKFDLQNSEIKKNKLLVQLAEAELTLFKQEINPHFLFNSINNISFMVDIDSDKAKKMLNKLAQIYRRFVSFPKKNSIPITEELIIINNYLDLEKLRFGDRLTFKIDVDEIKELDKVNIPPLMMQTLVENSIKHGISKRREGGEIKIKIRPLREGYYFEIENPNRKKISPIADEVIALKENDEKKFEGNGLENTRRRLELLFGKEKADFTVTNDTFSFKVSFWFSGLTL